MRTLVVILLLVAGGAGCVFDASGFEIQPAEEKLDGSSSREHLQQVDGRGTGTEGQPDAASYAWKTGPWSSCSKTCGGGTQSRSVWCERDNGTKVADSYCTGTVPATSQVCNTQPCCSTAPCCKNPCCGDPLQNKMVCDGKEKVQWTTWGQNKGDAADRASCVQKCVSWAKSQGYKLWCCRLYEDSSPGTNWVCRVYQSGSMSTLNSSVNYSGLGHCP